MKMFNLSCVLILVLFSGLAFCAPQPTLSKLPNIWTLDVTIANPQQISMRLDGDPTPSRFWYMFLTVTNKTDQDVPFYPQLDLTTDTLKSIPVGPRQMVFDKIKNMYQSRYPFLENIESATNKILPGQDNTRDFAIIFPDFDPSARVVKIYISGLSNETKIIDHPSEKDPNGKPIPVILKKTLELEYTAFGDRTLRDNLKLNLVGKRWVMR